MADEIYCPQCGKPNERSKAEAFRMCVHCGADLSVGDEGPTQDFVGGPAGAPPAMPSPVPPGAPQQPPPGGVQPPYAQQGYGAPPPYGQPQYGQPPYPYGYPPQPWPPTYHPEAYSQPEEPPRFDAGALLGCLFKPKETFERIYKHTSATQGIAVAVVFIIVSSLVALVLVNVVVGEISENADTGILGPDVTASVVGQVVSIVIGVLNFFLVAWIVAALIKGSSRRPSTEKTLGLLGYARMPGFIMGLIIIVPTAFMLANVDWDALADMDETNLLGGPVGDLIGWSVLILALSVASFIWSLWVTGHAVSVANDTSLSSAVGYTFLAWILAALITFGLTFGVNSLLSMF